MFTILAGAIILLVFSTLLYIEDWIEIAEFSLRGILVMSGSEGMVDTLELFF